MMASVRLNWRSMSSGETFRAAFPISPGSISTIWLIGPIFFEERNISARSSSVKFTFGEAFRLLLGLFFVKDSLGFFDQADYIAHSQDA